jgi:phosphorylase kinase alpha/beta subunit
MYFFIPEGSVEFEKQEPGSQVRQPSGEGSGVKGMFLWNQAMFVIAQLLTAGLLHINELDPIRRYLPSYNRPRKAGRYSAFQVGYDVIWWCFLYASEFPNLFLYTDV